jgi:hypothetical protein
MWAALVLVVMMSLTGLYAISDVTSPRASENANAAQLADSMDIYRSAVIQYFTSNPAGPQRVDIATLNAAGLFPEWSVLRSRPDTSIWDNYMNAAGRIYIYAAEPPPPDVVTHVLKRSYNSVLVGVFRTGDATLCSPVFGNTNIPLPLPVEAQIPNGSPVWVAMRN